MIDKNIMYVLQSTLLNLDGHSSKSIPKELDEDGKKLSDFLKKKYEVEQ